VKTLVLAQEMISNYLIQFFVPSGPKILSLSMMQKLSLPSEEEEIGGNQQQF
jgi:hypothetical protein